MAKDKDTNFIIEFIPSGKFVKVTAVDPRSGREVSIVGDASAGEKELSRIAVNKLLYVLYKEKLH